MRTRIAQVSRWCFFIVAAVAVGASLFWAISWATNPLLGRWIQASADSGRYPGEIEASGERGIEFFTRSRFAMFGYKVDGRIVNPYGTYSFESNRVKLQTTGFRAIIDGTNADVKLKFPPELNRPRYLKYSHQAQELEEEDIIPARFTRETKRGR
jgi:hypothetical protein